MVIIYKYWFFLIPSLLFSPSFLLLFPYSILTLFPFPTCLQVMWLCPRQIVFSRSLTWFSLFTFHSVVSPLDVDKSHTFLFHHGGRCGKVPSRHRAEKGPGKWRGQRRTSTQQRVHREWCSETPALRSRWKIVSKQPAHFQNTDC